ncbi:hypothetical protein N7528_001780 [Penicillium herquei]|nr:hypothetical protein N7528_001780 [Penicillium herquei]
MEATEYLSKITSNAHHSIAPMPLQPEIEVSLWIMVSTLKFEVAQLFSAGIPKRPCIDDDVETCSILLEKMRTDGWCKSHVEMLARGMDAAAMYYIGTLGPPKIPKDHSRCSNRKCEADQIIEDRYVTKHRFDDCKCEQLGPDLAQITSILSNGGIPCIQLGFDHSQQSRETDVSQKVAINMKAVPFLSTALALRAHGGIAPNVKLEDDTVYLWMDTFCVPLQPEPARQQAIRCMRRVYTEARAVLVLESELLMSTVNCSNEERLMRITGSTWLHRLWTYQEGYLAQSMIFQFAERAIPIEELWNPLINGSDYDRFSNGIAVQGTHFFQTLRQVKTYHSPCQFASLLDALQWRQTSKPRDECICVGSMFGLDMNQIMGVSDDQKFKKLLQLQGDFVSDIIFLSGPKMTEEGYGWASFMRARGTEVLDMVHSNSELTAFARWTPHGLLGAWHGLEIVGVKTDFAPENFLLYCSTNNMRYIITRATEANSEDIPDWRVVGPHTMERSAIISEHSMASLRGRSRFRAVLGEIRRKDHGVWYVRYKCRIVVKEFEERDAISYGWKLDQEGKPVAVRELQVGEFRKYPCQWCIA